MSPDGCEEPQTTEDLEEQHRLDEHWMEVALAAAREAGAEGDVPVGAVLVRDGVEVARSGNRRERDRDPTAHAEILVLRRAGAILDRWRLDDCTLYVTLEPCAMCAGALVQARLGRLVFGTPDPKGGFCGSLGDTIRDSRLNHRVPSESGVLAANCSRLLVDFFRARREGSPERRRSL